MNNRIEKAEDPHRQLYKLLKIKIADGTFRPHAKLPAERVLAGEYGLSQVTVNKAVKQLEAQGLVYTKRGIGVFISAVSREYSLNRLHSFRDWCVANGHEPQTKVVELRNASEADLALFRNEREFTEGNYVFMLRHRLVDGKPAIHEVRLINRALFTIEQLKSMNDSYFEFLSQNLPDPVTSSRRSMQLVSADTEAATFLGTGTDRTIRISGCTTDSSGVVIDLDILFYHPDRFTFDYKLTN